VNELHWIRCLVVTGAVLAGCPQMATSPGPDAGGADATSPGPDDATADRPRAGDDIVVRMISPTDTAADIQHFTSPHVVTLDDSVRHHGTLMVYLPGHGGVPSNALRFQRAAAREGYHVIGLTYPNDVALADACQGHLVVCSENAHLETIDGTDRTTVVDVDRTNSIENRLVRLLQHLDHVYPREGWGAYLDGVGPRWGSIAFAGHSQGGGNATMIAREHAVARVITFSAPVDDVMGDPPPWTGAAHQTPAARYYGLVHRREGFYQGVVANWEATHVPGALVSIDDAVPTYGNSHRLTTGAMPSTGSFDDAHSSTVVDRVTPIDRDGDPVFLDAWRYMIGP
jgi:hypothetical protein